MVAAFVHAARLKHSTTATVHLACRNRRKQAAHFLAVCVRRKRVNAAEVAVVRGHCCTASLIAARDERRGS